jgi:hypothetical protein
MRQIEQFMRELFEVRIAEEKRILAERAAYRKRFFAPDCRWDNRQFTLEMKTEKIVSIEGSESEPSVVTEFKASVSPPSAQMNRRRYRLKAEGDSFLISHVQLQCPYCHGQGDEGCMSCKGKHWL